MKVEFLDEAWNEYVNWQAGKIKILNWLVKKNK